METISDILKEMRFYVDECNRGVTPHTRYGNGAFPLDDLVDRIETAHKREMADALDTSESVTNRNLLKLNEILNEANGIAESAISPYVEEKAWRIYDLCKQIDLQGNGAKMREALAELICGWDIFINGLEEDLDGHYPAHYQARRSDYEKRIHKAKSAFSAPPRNCDLPTVIADPHGAWLKDRDNWDEFGNPEKEIYEWLLAKAKGGHNGK